MVSILVACGSGITTSAAVAAKVQKMLDERGVPAVLKAVEMAKIDDYVAQGAADIVMPVIKTDKDFGVPVFSGMAFLTGMGEAREFERLIETINTIDLKK